MNVASATDIMNFHIPTAMQLTAVVTLVIGLGLAYAASGFPRALQYPVRLWVRGLLLQSLPYFLFASRGHIPDFLSIVAANSLLILALAHQIQALRRFNQQSDQSSCFAALFGLTLIGTIILTWLWPSIYARIVLVSVVVAVLCAFGISAIYRKQKHVTRAEQVVAVTLFSVIVVMLARIAVGADARMLDLTTSTPLQGIVFTFSPMVPVILTAAFMLMCGERLNANLKQLAMVDPLTGVYNRRTMSELAGKAVAQAQRHGRPLSLFTLDIDHFKRINDEFGHEAGDQALCAVVDVVQSGLRESDLIARLGGEEFVVLLPDTDEEAASRLADRVRKRVEDSGFTVGGWPAPLRVSIGVGSLGGAGDDLATLMRETDRALYTAKRAGRNRVVNVSQIHRPSPQQPMDASVAS